jgi:hypothetical protein
VGRFGRRREYSFHFFDFLAPDRALRCTENPRVDGSMPSLATISNSMIRMRFRVSPADYPCPLMADPWTIENRVSRRTAAMISALTDGPYRFEARGSHPAD